MNTIEVISLVQFIKNPSIKASRKKTKTKATPIHHNVEVAKYLKTSLIVLLLELINVLPL